VAGQQQDRPRRVHHHGCTDVTREHTIQHYIITDDVEPSPEEENRILRRELRAVHEELTRLAEERDALAALWQGRDDSGLRNRARAVKRQVGRLLRRYRAKEVNTLQVGRQLLRIGYANTLQDPVEWAGRFKELRAGAIDPQYRGDLPVHRAKKPQSYGQGLLWKDLLEPTSGDDPSFQKAARYLAVKTGNVSEELALTSRLGVTDLAVRKAIAQVNGRARELSGWIPRIPGPRTPVEPVSEGRVVHLLKESRPYLSNGFTSRSHQTLLAERGAGLDPVVITELGFPRSVVGADFAPVEDVGGIPHHRLDTGIDYGRVPADRWLEDFAWYAYRRIREIRPAAIHVSSGRRGFETALVALALREKTGIPVVYEVRSFFETTWTAEPEVEEDSEVYRRRLAVEEMCMREADAVLTLGTAMRDELVSRGIPADRIGIVPNGVDLGAFAPRERDQELAARHRINRPTFGYVSNMDHRREGQEVLIKAASLLKERGVDAQCVLVGGGARVEGLRKLAQLYDVVDRVVFTGPVDHEDIAAHYALIDVFVVPRVRERAATYVTPLKPFEAMAMERPVVVSDLPALAEIVEAPQRGRVFEPGDAAGLADAVQVLLADPEERQRLGRAGRDWVERERQWSHNGPRYRAVYEEVVERARCARQSENEEA
jgi:phosphatidyl-myo-inositol dimannoside synthase